MAGLPKTTRLLQSFSCLSKSTPWIHNLSRMEIKTTIQSSKRFVTLCRQCDILKYQNDGQSKPMFHHAQQIRSQSSVTPTIGKESLLKRILTNYGYRMKYKRFDMMRAGLRIYLCTAELVDTEQFFKEFDLPDTFNSWFTVLSLHVWMCMCRLQVEGKEGQYVRNIMMKKLWEDVAAKAKKLGPLATPSGRNEGLQSLNTVFQYSLVSYDEGIMDHDRVLAGAIWRHFFYQKCDDPQKIEKLVHYVHKQLRHLEYQESETIIKSGLITYLPLNGDKLNEDRNQTILKEIWARS